MTLSISSRLRLPTQVFALAALLWALAAHAQRPQNVTPAEMALLPSYCVDTQGFNYGDASWNTSPRASYWVARMGPTFWHQHHYCWALIKWRRALEPGLPPQVRNGRLGDAIGDLEYVVRNATPDFPLLPEVFYRIAEIQLLLDNQIAAKEALDDALRRKPDYWPAYLLWANTLAKAKLTREARAHLELGLRQSPRSPQLREAYRALGGDPGAFVAELPASAPALPASGVSARSATQRP
ncbi:MAG: hypothetical protein LKCHEGNO_00076 [Burkholderiaceae bacterium]|nr:hypothetical protein [Burkholderiaceae bacterium]